MGRRFWLLLAISVATLILSGLALGLVLTRTLTGPTSVYSASFVAGTIGGCGEILGWSGYCDLLNVTLPGGNTSDRLVLLEVTLNESCPSGCTVALGSYPRDSSRFQALQTEGLNRSAGVGGVIWGGSDWVESMENAPCMQPAGCRTYTHLQVNIQIEDYGSVPN